jgi:hypothetical protein
MLRVEHYGKGASAKASQFTKSRPIQAVTGAFISMDRSWYELLGGFTEDYVFGHYEDADLCLKSLRAGIVPWIHDIRLWHLEGKGSLRLPVHEGGSLVNRWLFTSAWSETVSNGLEGPNPTSEMMLPPAERNPPAIRNPGVAGSAPGQNDTIPVKKNVKSSPAILEPVPQRTPRKRVR